MPNSKKKRTIKVYEDGSLVYEGLDKRYFDQDYQDHDLLNRIDTNLDIFMKNFSSHQEDDCKRFDKIDRRLVIIERVCYGVGGVFVFMEFILKLIK